jgi:hypothetical protein
VLIIHLSTTAPKLAPSPSKVHKRGVATLQMCKRV